MERLTAEVLNDGVSGTDSDLYWSIAPHAVCLSEQSRGAVRPLIGGWIRNCGRVCLSSTGPRIYQVGSVIFASVGNQDHRVLKPVALALGEGSERLTERKLPILGFRESLSLAGVVAKATRRLKRLSKNSGADWDARLSEQIGQAELLRRRSDLLFVKGEVKVLVVATQHNAAVRSMLRSAHHAGVRTIYLPHAPLASNIAYQDLPVNHALLRGPAEVEIYQLGGANQAGLMVVGDPSLPVLRDNSQAHSDQIVVAGSPNLDRDLGFLIPILNEAGLTQIVISPHPRVKGRIRGYPSSYRLSSHRTTADLLHSEGAKVLIQSNSGVGLDALRMGIPVIDLRAQGARPIYPFLEDPVVLTAASGGELDLLIKSLPASKDASTAARRLAEQWSARLDGEPAKLAAEAIRNLTGQSPLPPLIMDTWKDIGTF